jgi:parvulin-like peptidyl-prolyl isomerase
MKPRNFLLSVPSLLALAAGASPEVIERVVAKVNGDILTFSEFVNRQAAAVQAARVAGAGVERFLRENNARILQEAVDELLLVQRADELGIRLRPEYIADVIEGIRKENNIASDEALREQLEREGMTLDDLKRNIERSILKRQVLTRELEAKVAVTEAEARADYDARQADYTTKAQVRLQEILVAAAEGRDAQEDARRLVARARSGEDFAALAREHSDAPTRGAGGELGAVNLGEMNPLVEQELAALRPGDVSEPVALAEGYRIFRVVERSDASVVPYEQVREQITRRLTQERYAREYDAYIEGLRKTAAVEIKVREVPLALDPSAPAGGSMLEDALDRPAPQASPAAGAAAAAPTPSAPADPNAPEPEFETTPQAAPERVAPAPAPAPAASPSPSPSPEPPVAQP